MSHSNSKDPNPANPGGTVDPNPAQAEQKGAAVAIFYRWINQGVIAVVPRVVYLNVEAYQRKADPWQEVFPGQTYPKPYPRPIFTFVRPDHYRKTHLKHFVTGDYELMDRLLDGHVVEDCWFYVPFSRRIELSEDEDGPEHQFRTTLAEAIEAFELVRPSVVVVERHTDEHPLYNS